MINFDPRVSATFKFEQGLGLHHDYILRPGADPVVRGASWSSRLMMLNGKVMAMESPDWHLPAEILGGGVQNKGVVMLPPLTVAFAVFPHAQMSACL